MKINKQVLFIVCFIFICHFIDNSTTFIEGFTSTDMVIKFQDSSDKVKQFFINTICPLYQFLPVDLCGRHGIWNSETCSCDYHLCNKDEHSDVCSFSNNEDKTRPCHVILGPQPEDANFCSQFTVEAGCSGITSSTLEKNKLSLLHTQLDAISAQLSNAASASDITSSIILVEAAFGDLPVGDVHKFLEPTHNLFVQTASAATASAATADANNRFTDILNQYKSLVHGFIDTDEKQDPTARCQWNQDKNICQPKDHCVLKTSDHNTNICEDINTGIDYIDKIYNIHVNDDVYQDPFDTFGQSLIDGGENINDVLQSIHNNIAYSGQATLEDYFTYKISSIGYEELSYIEKRNMIFFEFLQDYYHYYLKDPTNQASFDSDWFQTECEQYKIDKAGEPLCLYDMNNGLSTCSLNSESIVKQFDNSCHTYNSDHTNCRSLGYCEYDVGCKSCPEGTYTIDSFSNVCKKPDNNQIIQTIFGPNSSSVPLDGDTNPRKCFEKDLEKVPCYDVLTGSSTCPEYQISNSTSALQSYDTLINPGMTDPTVTVLKESSGQRSSSNDNILNIFGTVPNDTNTECESCKFDAHLFHDFDTLNAGDQTSVYVGAVITAAEHKETYYCGVNKKWVKQIGSSNFEPYHFPVEESASNGELIDHCNIYDNKAECNSDISDIDDGFKFNNHNCIYNENTDKCVSTCNSNLSYAVDSNDNGNCVNCSHGYFPIQRNFNALQFECEIDPSLNLADTDKPNYCTGSDRSANQELTLRSEMCLWNDNFINPENGETGRCQKRDYHIYSGELDGTLVNLHPQAVQQMAPNYDWVRVDNDNVPIMDSCESCHAIGKMYGRVSGECSDCPDGTKLQVTLRDGVYDYQCLKTSYCPPNQNTIHTKVLDAGQPGLNKDVCECDHRSYGKGIFPHAPNNMGNYENDQSNYNNVWKTPSCNPTDPSFDDSCFNIKDQAQCESNVALGCTWIGGDIDGFCACQAGDANNPNQCSLNYGTEHDMYLSEDFLNPANSDTANGLTNKMIIDSFTTSPSISNDNLMANGFIDLSGKLGTTNVVADKFLLCNYNGSYGSCESCGDELDYETNTYLSNPKGQREGDINQINQECSKCKNTEYEQYECADVCSMKNIQYEDAQGNKQPQQFISYPFSTNKKQGIIRGMDGGETIHVINRYIDDQNFKPIDYDPIETFTMNKMKSYIFDGDSNEQGYLLNDVVNWLNLTFPNQLIFGSGNKFYNAGTPPGTTVAQGRRPSTEFDINVAAAPGGLPGLRNLPSNSEKGYIKTIPEAREITRSVVCDPETTPDITHFDACQNSYSWNCSNLEEITNGNLLDDTDRSIDHDYVYFNIDSEPIPSFIPLPTTYDRNLHYHNLNNENYDYKSGYGEILPELAVRDAISLGNCEELSEDNCNNSSRCSYDNSLCSERTILDRYTVDPGNPADPADPVSDFSSGGLLRGYQYGSPGSTQDSAKGNIIGRHELTYSIIDTPYLFPDTLSSNSPIPQLVDTPPDNFTVVEGFTGFDGSFGPTNYVENTNILPGVALPEPCVDDPSYQVRGVSCANIGPHTICSEEQAVGCPLACRRCPPTDTENPENLTYMKRSKDAQVDLLLSDSDVDFSIYNDPTRYRKVDLYDACNQLNETSKDICENYYINTTNTEQLINTMGSFLGMSSPDDTLFTGDSNQCKYDGQTNTCYNTEHPLKAYSQTNMKQDIIDNGGTGYSDQISEYRDKDFDFFRYLFGLDDSSNVVPNNQKKTVHNQPVYPGRQSINATVLGASDPTSGKSDWDSTTPPTDWDPLPQATTTNIVKRIWASWAWDIAKPLESLPAANWPDGLGYAQAGWSGWETWTGPSMGRSENKWESMLSPIIANSTYVSALGSQAPDYVMPQLTRYEQPWENSFISDTDNTILFIDPLRVKDGSGQEYDEGLVYLPPRMDLSTRQSPAAQKWLTNTDWTPLHPPSVAGTYPISVDLSVLFQDQRGDATTYTDPGDRTTRPDSIRNLRIAYSTKYGILLDKIIKDTMNISNGAHIELTMANKYLIGHKYRGDNDLSTGALVSDTAQRSWKRSTTIGGRQESGGALTADDKARLVNHAIEAIVMPGGPESGWSTLERPSFGDGVAGTTLAEPGRLMTPCIIVDINDEPLVVPLKYITSENDDISGWLTYEENYGTVATNTQDVCSTTNCLIDDGGQIISSQFTGDIRRIYDSYSSGQNTITRHYPAKDSIVQIIVNSDSIKDIHTYTNTILSLQGSVKGPVVTKSALEIEELLYNVVHGNKWAGCDYELNDIDGWYGADLDPVDPIKLRHKELIKRYWEENTSIGDGSVWDDADDTSYETCYDSLNGLYSDINSNSFAECMQTFSQRDPSPTGLNNCSDFGLDTTNYPTISTGDPRLDNLAEFFYHNIHDASNPYTDSKSDPSAGYDVLYGCDGTRQQSDNCTAGNYIFSDYTSYPFNMNSLYLLPPPPDLTSGGLGRGRLSCTQDNDCPPDGYLCGSRGICEIDPQNPPDQYDSMINFNILPNTVNGPASLNPTQVHPELNLYDKITTGDYQNQPLYRLWGDQLYTQSNEIPNYNLATGALDSAGSSRNTALLVDNNNPEKALYITDPFHRMNVRTAVTADSASSEFKPIVNNNMLWSTTIDDRNLDGATGSIPEKNTDANKQSYFVEKYCALRSFPETHPSNKISSDNNTSVDDPNTATGLSSEPISATGFDFTDFIYDCIPDVVNGVSQLIDNLWNTQRPIYDPSNLNEISTCENIFSNIENDISRRLIMEKIDDRTFHTDITEVYTSSLLDSNIPTMNEDVSSNTIANIDKYNELSRVRVGGFCKGTNCEETVKKPIEVDERCVGPMDQTPVNLDDLAEIARIQENNVACANTNLKDVSSYTDKKARCETRTDNNTCRYIAPKNIIDLNKSKYQYMLFGQNDNKKNIIEEHLQTTLSALFNSPDIETDTATNFPTDWTAYRDTLLRMRDRGLYNEPVDPHTHDMTDTELASDVEPIIWRNEIVDQMVRICGEFNNQNLGSGTPTTGDTLPGSIQQDADNSLHKFLTDNELVSTEELDNYSCRLLPVEDYCLTQGLDDICEYTPSPADPTSKCKLTDTIKSSWNNDQSLTDDIDICNYAGGPPNNPGSIKSINKDQYNLWKDANPNTPETIVDKINRGEPELSDIYYNPKLSCTSRKTGYQPKELKFQNGDADVISDPNKDNYGLDIFVDVDGTGNKVRIPELCRREEVCKECSDINVEEMKDLININKSIKNIYHNTGGDHSTVDVITTSNITLLNLTLDDFDFLQNQPGQQAPSDISQIIDSTTHTLTGNYAATTLQQVEIDDLVPEAVSNPYNNYKCALKKYD